MAPFGPFLSNIISTAGSKKKCERSGDWPCRWLLSLIHHQKPSQNFPQTHWSKCSNKMQGASQKLHAFYMFTSDDRTTWRSSLLLARILAAGKSDTKNARGRPSKVELIITNDNYHQKYSYTMERAAVGFGWLLSLYIVLLQLWMTAWVWCNTIATSAFPLYSTTEPCFF